MNGWCRGPGEAARCPGGCFKWIGISGLEWAPSVCVCVCVRVEGHIITCSDESRHVQMTHWLLPNTNQLLWFRVWGRHHRKRRRCFLPFLPLHRSPSPLVSSSNFTASIRLTFNDEGPRSLCPKGKKSTTIFTRLFSGSHTQARGRMIHHWGET